MPDKSSAMTVVEDLSGIHRSLFADASLDDSTLVYGFEYYFNQFTLLWVKNVKPKSCWL